MRYKKDFEFSLYKNIDIDESGIDNIKDFYGREELIEEIGHRLKKKICLVL